MFGIPRLIKRSVSIAGSSTSVMLEPEFWTVLETMAVEKELLLSKLLWEIDMDRRHRSLASACRIACLKWALAKSRKAD